MSKVQIDDFICQKCGKAGLGELDIKTGKYKSLVCDCENKAKEILERLEELEKQARYNRDKWDDIPLINWLEDDEQEEYNKLMDEYNSLEIKE